MLLKKLLDFAELPFYVGVRLYFLFSYKEPID